MLTLSPAEVTQRVIDGDYRAADSYGIAWLYPGHRLDLVQSRTVWRPEYAPYAPLNWGNVDAMVVDIPTSHPSTMIRACVDGWCHSGTAHVPIVEGDAETLGRRHVLRACEYARSRGWRVPSRVNPGATLEIDGWARAVRDQRDITITDRPAWAEGDSRGPYCGTRG